MALEVGTRINDLVATNPLSSDPAGQGDDHLRLIKACIKGSLPNIGGILGQYRNIDVATSLSSTWNTSRIVSTNSATATVVLTLPPSASITTGFYLELNTLLNANISLVASGVDTVNSAASVRIPPRSRATVFYAVGGAWFCDIGPSGFLGVSEFGTPVIINGDLSVSGAVTLVGATSIIGAATLASTLSVSGNATLLGGLDVKGGTASFSTAVYMASTLTVSGIAVLGAALVGALSVSGVVTAGGISSAGAIIGASTLSVSGAAHMNTTLSVGGATTLGGTLTVSGTTVMQGAATVGGTLSVSGGAHLNTTLSVGGATTLGSTLSVSGNAVVGGTMAVNGAFSAASGSFGGGGFTGNLTLGGTLTVSGATVLASTIAVRGAATLDTTLSVSGAATFKSASSFAASVVIGTTLNVAGATTLSGAATLKGTASIGGAATLGSTLTVSGTVAFLGLLQLGGNLNLNNGIINFPAVQNPSAGANSLDDYEEGTWTPFIDYAVTGNLNVVYSLQSGAYTKIGRHVSAHFTLTTSTFTHTTASGTMVISGFPFASTFAAFGTLSFEGMLISTGANYDGPILRLATGTTAALTKSGINNNSRADLDQNSHTSGNNVLMNGTITYEAS